MVDAFAALLCSLAFKVSIHTANCGAEPECEAMWGNHVVLVVHLEAPYVADVGLGEGPRAPFRVAPGRWREDGFDFEMLATTGHEWRLRNPANVTGALPGFAFDLGSCAEGFQDFEGFHDFYWTHKELVAIFEPFLLGLKVGSGLQLCLKLSVQRRLEPEMREMPAFNGS